MSTTNGKPLPPAKAALRAVLLARGERLGLTPLAVQVLVERAELAWLRPRAAVQPPDGEGATAIVVCGALMVRCGSGTAPPVTVQVAGPGQLVALGWQEDHERVFRASALVPTVVAIVARGAIREALALLPADRRLRFAAYGCQALSGLLADAAECLVESLDARVLRALRRLASVFGAPHAHGGTEIRLRLRTADLAELVTATRPNVSRCLTALRRTGQIRQVDGSWVLADAASETIAASAAGESA